MCHSERMTDAELSRLSEICEAATAGPWEYDGQHFEIHAPHNDNYWVIVSEECDAPNDAPVDEFGHQYSPDYAFIAAARTAMPRLLAEVKALRSVLERVEWCNGYRNLTHECPICGNDQDEGHHSTCQLAAVLGRRTTAAGLM